MGYFEIGRVNPAAESVGTVCRTDRISRRQRRIVRNRCSGKVKRPFGIDSAAVGDGVPEGLCPNFRLGNVSGHNTVGQFQRTGGRINPAAAGQRAACQFNRRAAVLNRQSDQFDLVRGTGNRKDTICPAAVDNKTAIQVRGVDRHRFVNIECPKRRGKGTDHSGKVGIEGNDRRKNNTINNRPGIIDRLTQRNDTVREIKFIVRGCHDREPAPPGAHFRRTDIRIGIGDGTERLNREVVFEVPVETGEDVRGLRRIDMTLNRA